jgi:hypothetical protein
MQKSELINDLAAALSKAQAQMKPALKNKVNPAFKSKYADLDACWDAARVPMSSNGLSVSQFVNIDGKAVTVTTLLMHASGQWISGDVKIVARDEGAHQIGSAISYGRRYGFCAAVGITSDEDDDGNDAHGIGAPPAKVAKTANPAPARTTQPAPPIQVYAPPEGFNPNNPDHKKGMDALLAKEKIEEPGLKAEILKRMVGRPKEDLLRVIEDVMYPPDDLAAGVFEPQ